MEFTISQHTILEASRHSETVRLMLLVLFPKAFENLPAMKVKNSINSNAIFSAACYSVGLDKDAMTVVNSNHKHQFYLKALELSGKYEWELSEDHRGHKILIPRLK